MFAQLKKCDPIKVLGWVQFFNALGLFLLITLLALLLLEAPFVFESTWIAIIVGIYAFTCHAFEPLTASFAKKFSFRNSLAVGGIICSSSLLTCVVFSTPIFCLTTLLFFSWGRSLVSLTIKLRISEIEEDEKRLLGFGRNYRIANIAAGITPVFAFWIDYTKHVKEIFIMTSGFVLLGAIISFLFLDNSKVTKAEATIANKSSWPEGLGEVTKVAVYYFILFYGVFCTFQINLTPFFLKKFSHIPFYFGYILAINPVLVVLFQKKVSKFYGKYFKNNDQGYIYVFLAISLAFASLSIGCYSIMIVLFVVFLTIAEMIIFSTIDYSITKTTKKLYHPFLLSLNGIMIAIGRSFAEGGGIYGLSYISRLQYSGAYWWRINFLISVVVFVVFLFILFGNYKSAKSAQCATV